MLQVKLMLQVISAVVDIVRKDQREKNVWKDPVIVEAEEMWGHGTVFASLTHRHQRNIPKGTSSGDSDGQNSFSETMTFPQPLPITRGWLGLGAVWKYFLLHSYH